MKKNETRKKYVDEALSPRAGAARRELAREWLAAHARRTPMLIALALLLILSNSVIYLTAFEAHVINVTAVIERPPMMCDALSIGYWRNHEGCDQGEGESVWTDEIHTMTENFSGLFYNTTGEEICQDLWIPDCPSGNNIPAKRCRATAMALADELSLVSGRLQLEALIAGADNGNSAFDHLGLNYNSTVEDALVKIEMIIGNTFSSKTMLNDAAYVAERIYAFYEDENPNAPQCVTEPEASCSSSALRMAPLSQDSDEEENDEDNGGRDHDSADENSGGVNEDNNDENNRGENPELNPEQEQNENATSSEEVAENEPTATSSEE